MRELEEYGVVAGVRILNIEDQARGDHESHDIDAVDRRDRRWSV